MATEGVTRYPLCWPVGKPRCQYRTDSRFKVASFARVRDELLNELKLMRARDVILSSNLKLRIDGLPLANQAQPADPGVAVYFTYNKKDLSFACDRWRKIEDNMQAIRHTIEALRGIARWGTGDMVDAAFSGFAALPEARATALARWWEVLGVKPHDSTEAVNAAYRRLVLEHHPDRHGNADRMAEINAAYSHFRRERGDRP